MEFSDEVKFEEQVDDIKLEETHLLDTKGEIDCMVIKQEFDEQFLNQGDHLEKFDSQLLDLEDLPIALHKKDLDEKESYKVPVLRVEINSTATDVRQSQDDSAKDETQLTEGEMFLCDQCDHQTRTRYTLRRHKLIHRNSSNVAKVNKECAKGLKYKRKLRATFQIFSCNQCEFKTWYKHSLKTHILGHHYRKKDVLFKCDKCIYTTKRNGNLSAHFQRYHSTETQVNPYLLDLSDVEIFQCYECTYKSKWKCNLRAHIFSVHKKSIYNPTSHILTGDGIYSCDQCAFQTKSKSGIKIHCLRNQVLSEGGLFHCYECTYKSKWKCNLKTHILSVHKKSESKGNPENHILTDDRIYACDQCGFETKNKYGFQSHSLRHQDLSEGERFQCYECSYKSKWKGNLKSHIFSVHKKSGSKDNSENHTNKQRTVLDRSDYLPEIGHKQRTEMVVSWIKCESNTKDKHELQPSKTLAVQLFKCNLCTYASDIKQVLQKHMKTHMCKVKSKLLHCESCDFQTNSVAIFERHKLKHADSNEFYVFKDNMYCCTKCNQKAKYKSTLKVHYVRHQDKSELRLFECNKCSYIAKRKSNLREHMLIHVKDTNA